MSPMYVVAKWLEIGMIPPASVKKKVYAAPAPLKKSPPCKPVKAPLRCFPGFIY